MISHCRLHRELQCCALQYPEGIHGQESLSSAQSLSAYIPPAALGLDLRIEPCTLNHRPGRPTGLAQICWSPLPTFRVGSPSPQPGEGPDPRLANPLQSSRQLSDSAPESRQGAEPRESLRQ